jgi:predicted nicotinamide N-methyase
MEMYLFSLESFHQDYETETRDIVIDDYRFQFFVPESIERFVDPEDPLQNFPLWAKIWQASVVLAQYLIRMPVEPQKRILEIGSGLGLVGIAAACAGHAVTMTDYNTDALNFARANAQINSCLHLQICRLDWIRPNLEGAFDYIVGSEIVYKNQDITHLLALFKKYLRPGGKILLVEEMRKTLNEFYKQMNESYKITVRKKILRAHDEESRVLLIEMVSR